jgi:hypothetical protein
MTNDPHPNSDNTQPAVQPASENHHPDPATATTNRMPLWGLKISGSLLGKGVLMVMFAIWYISSLILGLICFVLAIAQSSDLETVFEYYGMHYFAIACLAILAVAFAFEWFSQLFARILWLGVENPLAAKLLAVVSALGRLSILFALIYLAVIYLGSRNESFSIVLVNPVTITCAVIAWLGIASDWCFIRILHRHLVSKNPEAGTHSTKVQEQVVDTDPGRSNIRNFFSKPTNREYILFGVIAILAIVMTPVDELLGILGRIAIGVVVLLQVTIPVKQSLVDEVICSLTPESRQDLPPDTEQV